MISISKDCVVCGSCVSICPMCALEIKKKKLSCNSNCVNCKTCINACPFLALSIKRHD